ncbi:MAG: hypothetical protein ACREPR_02190 [Brasilonema sp.]
MGSEVIARVLAIAEKTSDTLQVAMSLGNERYEFMFKLEKEATAPNFVSLLEDRQFSQLFKFNAPISSQVLKLIAQVIKGEKVEFPVEMGQFYPPEPALAQQKPFEAELLSKS